MIQIMWGGVIFLTNNKNAHPLFEWIRGRCKAELYSGRIQLDQIREKKPDLIISYNYKYIISDEIIEYMKGSIINLHISFLPWNRGSNPNLWSFIDDTPKGVTIHKISSGLDKGPVLYQQECVFEEGKETFESSYQKLNDAIVKLFKKNWADIRNGTYPLKAQAGKGSYHNQKDLEALKQKCPFQWSDNIEDYRKRYASVL